MFARMWYICTMSSHTDWSAILCPWSRYSVVTSLSLVVVRRRRPTTLMPPRPSGTHPPVLSSRVITWALTRASQSSLHHRTNHNCQAASLSDTIRDAILRCNQKLTRVSLIYRTEPTSKKWKNRKKTKSKKCICSEVLVNSPGNLCSQSWRRKGRLWWEGFAQKEAFKPELNWTELNWTDYIEHTCSLEGLNCWINYTIIQWYRQLKMTKIAWQNR